MRGNRARRTMRILWDGKRLDLKTGPLLVLDRETRSEARLVMRSIDCRPGEEYDKADNQNPWDA